jgi:hypothetical protein
MNINVVGVASGARVGRIGSISVSGVSIGQRVSVNGLNVPLEDKRAKCIKIEVVYDDTKETVQYIALPEDKGVEINIDGDVGSVRADTGNVQVAKGVTGNVDAPQGAVHIEGDVGGNVHSTNGPVRVRGEVRGNISTINGDIRR